MATELPEPKSSLPHRRSNELEFNENEQKLIWQELQSLRRDFNTILAYIKEQNNGTS